MSEEIHHLEEVRHFGTAVGQRKQGAWTKWKSAKDRAVSWSDLKHMEPKKLSFLIEAVYDVLPIPVNLHAWGLTTSDRCRAIGKTARLKHILTGYEYTLRSYTWRYNEIFAEFRKYVVRLPIKLKILSTTEQFSSLKKEIFRNLHVKICVNHRCLRAARTGTSQPI